MLPFSKRPAPPEEYFLRSGDFEAIDSRELSIPRAPRAPVFHHAPPPAYAYGAAPRYGYDRPTAPAPEPVAYAHHQAAMMSAPPPPHSLSPVAMGAYARGSSPTGPRSAETVVIRERPNIRWGVSILLMGALLGGALGIGMKAQKEREAWQVQQAAAAAAAELSPVAPVAPPQRVVLPAAPQQVMAAPARAAAPVAAANVVAPTLAAPPAKSVVIPPEQAVVVAPAPAHHEKHVVASRRTQKRSHARTHHSKKAVSKKAHAKHATHKKATHKKVAHKKATHSKHQTSRAPSDAQSILQAAINNTTNTL